LEEISAVLKLVLKVFVSQRLKDTLIVNVSLCLSERLHLLCFRTADSSADSIQVPGFVNSTVFVVLICVDIFKKSITVSVWTEIFLYLVCFL
jgi:hypothetical protein